jgi:hypothetical protein
MSGLMSWSLTVMKDMSITELPYFVALGECRE